MWEGVWYERGEYRKSKGRKGVGVGMGGRDRKGDTSRKNDYTVVKIYMLC